MYGLGLEINRDFAQGFFKLFSNSDSGAGSSSDSSLPGEVKQEPSNGHSDKSHIECVVSTFFTRQPLYSLIS